MKAQNPNIKIIEELLDAESGHFLYPVIVDHDGQREEVYRCACCGGTTAIDPPEDGPDELYHRLDCLIPKSREALKKLDEIVYYAPIIPRTDEDDRHDDYEGR